MKTRNFLAMMAMGAMSATLMLSCNNSAPKMDEQPSNQDKVQTTGMRIAIVEVDSLMSQYNFCKDYTAIITKKSTNARNTIQQKGKQLQAAAANFQQKLQNNGFTSREQAASVQICSARNRIFRNCKTVWVLNWIQKQLNTIRLCATLCRISSKTITRTRNLTLYCQRLATTSFMQQRSMTSLKK